MMTDPLNPSLDIIATNRTICAALGLDIRLVKDVTLKFSARDIEITVTMFARDEAFGVIGEESLKSIVCRLYPVSSSCTGL